MTVEKKHIFNTTTYITKPWQQAYFKNTMASILCRRKTAKNLFKTTKARI